MTTPNWNLVFNSQAVTIREDVDSENKRVSFAVHSAMFYGTPEENEQKLRTAVLFNAAPLLAEAVQALLKSESFYQWAAKNPDNASLHDALRVAFDLSNDMPKGWQDTLARTPTAEQRRATMQAVDTTPRLSQKAGVLNSNPFAPEDQQFTVSETVNSAPVSMEQAFQELRDSVKI